MGRLELLLLQLLSINTCVFKRMKKLQLREENRPALSGGMDWWRMEWPFSRVRKIFFRGRNFRENPWNSAERAIFSKFQAPKFENSEPEKMQFHTPSHSIPPLDSLLEKEPRPKLFGPDIFQWGRGLPREGLGAKKFDMSLETSEIKLFRRDIPGFCRDIPGGARKVREKQICVQFPFPRSFSREHTWLGVHKDNQSKALCGSCGTPPTFQAFPLECLTIASKLTECQRCLMILEKKNTWGIL